MSATNFRLNFTWNFILQYLGKPNSCVLTCFPPCSFSLPSCSSSCLDVWPLDDFQRLQGSVLWSRPHWWRRAQRKSTRSFAFSQKVSFSKRKGNLSFLEFVNKPLGETEELCLHFRSDLLRNACEHQYIGEMYSRTFHPCENITLLQLPRSLRPRVICWSRKLKMPGGYYN